MRWFSMGTQTFNDPKVVKLGERHGPLGLAVWTALLCNAGAQEEGGEISLTFRGLAHEVFDAPQEVAAVVDSVAEVGLIRLDSRDETAFDAVIPAWKRWGANARQAKSRDAKKGLDKADVTDPSRAGHDESRDVTTDRQTNKETKRTAGSSSNDLIAQALDKVAFARNLPSPKPHVVASTNAAFPAIDLHAEVSKFEHYWTEGPGSTRNLEDVGWAWRQWIGRATPADPTVAKAPASDRFAAYDAVIEGAR